MKQRKHFGCEASFTPSGRQCNGASGVQGRRKWYRIRPSIHRESSDRAAILSTVRPASCVCLLRASLPPRRCTNRNCNATAIGPINGMFATLAATQGASFGPQPDCVRNLLRTTAQNLFIKCACIYVSSESNLKSAVTCAAPSDEHDNPGILDDRTPGPCLVVGFHCKAACTHPSPLATPESAKKWVITIASTYEWWLKTQMAL